MSRAFSFHAAVRAAVSTLLIATCCAECPSAEPVEAVSSAAEPFRGILLLGDGGVLSGAITQTGQRYIVTTAGTEINVPAASVTMVCGSIEEAYERQRAAAKGQTEESRLRLAEWCLRHQLLSQAADELAEACRLDARHPKLALLERRLAVAREPRRATAAALAVAAAPRPAAKRSDESHQYRILVSELPPGAVERFTRKVQPVLVNNCATAGCHAPGGEQQFQLDRSLLHGMANRRTTMRNLSATLALVDRANPEKSPLLTVARREHGGMPKPVFGPYDHKLLLQLADWIALVTQQNAPDDDAPPDADIEWEISPGAALGTWNVIPLVAPVRHAAADVPQPSTAMQSDPYEHLESMPLRAEFFDGAETLRQPSQVRFGARLQPVEPRDEFDPAIFNQQFR